MIYKFLKNRFPEYLQWNDNQLLVHQDFEKRFNVRGLHFLHLNVRSVLHKISELRILFSRKSLAVIAFTETWLNDSINDEEINIDGYKVVPRDRTSRSGGGVCLYVRSDIAFNINIDIPIDDTESIWINVLLQDKNQLLWVFYIDRQRIIRLLRNCQIL